MSAWRKVGYCLVATVCGATVASAQDDTAIPNGIYVSAAADGSIAHDCTYEDPGTLKQGVAKIANNSVLVLMRGAYDIPAMFTNPTKTDGAYDYIKLTGKSGVTIRSIDNDPDGTVLYGDGSYGSEGLRLLYSSLQNSTYCGLTVSNFYGNWGGAITFHGGETISNCIFRCNKSKGIGGACRNGGKYVKCDFVLNVAEGADGGGALAYPGSVTDSTFSFNSGNKAGAILAAANMTVSKCQFYTNSAAVNGGVFYMNKSGKTVAFQDCRFEGNVGNWGGALSCDGGTLNTFDCWFVGNSATAGAAAHKGSHYNAHFVGNYANNGDGVVNGGSCSNCDFTANAVVAKTDAGSIGKSGTYRDCRIIGNTVNQYVFYGSTLYDCVIADNTSSGWFGPNACTSFRCVFSNNTASAYSCLVNGTAYNCLYFGNKISSSSIHASWGKLYNCTLVDNVGTAISGLSECKNVLAFGNTVDFSQDSANYTYCQYKTAKSQYNQDINLAGAGCKQIANPKFAKADSRHPCGYGLKLRSPAVNAGDPSIWTEADLDLAKCPRLTDGLVSVGCYEYWPNSGLALILK